MLSPSGVAAPLGEEVMNGGRSFGTMGKGLLSAKFLNDRVASFEFVLRDDDRLVILKCHVSSTW